MIPQRLRRGAGGSGDDGVRWRRRDHVGGDVDGDGGEMAVMMMGGGDGDDGQGIIRVGASKAHAPGIDGPDQASRHALTRAGRAAHERPAPRGVHGPIGRVRFFVILVRPFF